MRKFIALSTTMTALAGTALADGPSSGSMGLSYTIASANVIVDDAGNSFALPGPLVSSAAPSTLGVSYFTSDDAAIRADLGLAIGLGDETTTAFDVGVDYRSYTGDGAARGFWEAGLDISGLGVEDGMGVGLGGGIGVEYFFNDSISASGSTGLGVVVGLNDAPTTIASSSSGISASMYW